MRIKFSRNAVSFLEKITEKDKERIRQKIKTLVLSVEEHGIVPFREMDIKKLSGEWSEFLRMRIGKTRVIFRINREKDELLVYEIDFRGDVYKKWNSLNRYLSLKAPTKTGKAREKSTPVFYIIN